MLIGAMNHPGRDVVEELKWMHEANLDFIDLTFEPPAAASWKVNARDIRKALDDFGMGVVGHTAYYLPICSPFEPIRRAAVEELKRCLELFAGVGATWMNLHPDRHAPFHERSAIIERNLISLKELLPIARDCGVKLMIENLPGHFNTAAQLGEILDPLPELGLHLDIGHCNLLTEKITTAGILKSYASRLQHVHLHDNKGGQADLHLPLGTGTIDIPEQVSLLQKSGYDGTITLEVFSSDHRYLSYSRDLLRKLWDESLPVRSAA
jgi:sugar phosphate isomerase/epimerase